MKNVLFILVILIGLIASGQAQDKLKIGEVKSGKLVITNPDALRAFFLNCGGQNFLPGSSFAFN